MKNQTNVQILPKLFSISNFFSFYFSVAISYIFTGTICKSEYEIRTVDKILIAQDESITRRMDLNKPQEL